jgi:hypothetical protein
MTDSASVVKAPKLEPLGDLPNIVHRLSYNPSEAVETADEKPPETQPGATSLDSLSDLLRSLTERTPATVSAAQTAESGANPANVVPEPQSIAATPAPAKKRRRKARRERQRRMEAKTKRPPGRPSAFKKEFCEQARKLVLAGFTDLWLADFFSVSAVTFYNWQREYPAFKKALDRGRKRAEAEAGKSDAKGAKAFQNRRQFL